MNRRALLYLPRCLLLCSFCLLPAQPGSSHSSKAPSQPRVRAQDQQAYANGPRPPARPPAARRRSEVQPLASFGSARPWLAKGGGNPLQQLALSQPHSGRPAGPAGGSQQHGGGVARPLARYPFSQQPAASGMGGSQVGPLASGRPASSAWPCAVRYHPPPLTCCHHCSRRRVCWAPRASCRPAACGTSSSSTPARARCRSPCRSPPRP